MSAQPVSLTARSERCRCVFRSVDPLSPACEDAHRVASSKLKIGFSAAGGAAKRRRKAQVVDVGRVLMSGFGRNLRVLSGLDSHDHVIALCVGDYDAATFATTRQLLCLFEIPSERVSVLCNYDALTEWARAARLSGHACNKNAFIDENLFRPAPMQKREGAAMSGTGDHNALICEPRAEAVRDAVQHQIQRLSSGELDPEAIRRRHIELAGEHREPFVEILARAFADVGADADPRARFEQELSASGIPPSYRSYAEVRRDLAASREGPAL